MVGNKVQFAVVREDPNIECDVVRHAAGIDSVYLIGSGGCTALSLRSEFPNIEITAVDPNPAQINLIREKVRALSETDRQFRYNVFGVGFDDPKSLTACGNFESLFRSFRNFVYEFVYDREDWLSFFTGKQNKVQFEQQIFSSKYWSAAFQLFFSDRFLLAMFGRDAIQHAPPNSYSGHFQRVLEIGLTRTDATTNYFLHHIFLGHYIDSPNGLPIYLSKFPSNAQQFNYIEATAQDGPDFGKFDVIGLSNIFDWMNKDNAARLVKRLSNEMKAGAWLIYRQLNNVHDIRHYFGSTIKFDEERIKRLHAQDRSLFYSSIHIGQKI